MKKYLDLAKTEKVIIQRGRNETFVLVAQTNADEEDFRLISRLDFYLREKNCDSYHLRRKHYSAHPP